MTGRITHNTSNRMLLENLNRASRARVDAQGQLASQKQLQRPSDGPGPTVAALGHRTDLGRLEQFQRNANDARDRLSLTDDTLMQVNDQLTFASSRLIAAQSAATDVGTRQAIATELAGVKQALLDSANTSHRGVPLFSGTADVADAYTTSGVYQGDSGAVLVPISHGQRVQVNIPGGEVFGAPTTNPAQGDVFAVLDRAIAAVTAGDPTAMAISMSELKNATAQVDSAQVRVGARSNQVELVLARNDDAKATTIKALSELEDIDVAESLLELRTREFSYQTALGVAGRVMSQSLLDFLR